jgi:hypothetical protein
MPPVATASLARRMPVSVCAVVRNPEQACLAALEAQTRRADEVVVADADSWHLALADARSTRANWLWLIEGDAELRPDALEELLVGLEAAREVPAPLLLASKVLDASGRLDRRSAPWPTVIDRRTLMVAAQHRLVSLRMARWGSLLVRRAALEDHGLPRHDYAGGADDLEWTVRILRDHHGYLAPRSVVRTRRPSPGPLPPAREVRDRLRMLTAGGWVAHERLWFAFVLLAELGTGAARRVRREAP